MAKKSSGTARELIRVSAESIWSKPLTKRQKTVLDRVAARQKRGNPVKHDDSNIPSLSDRQLAQFRRVAKLLVLATLLLSASRLGAQNAGRNQDFPKFLGRTVTVTEPETDADGFYPKGPASICIEGPPRRQCYTAPDDFGLAPNVRLIQVQKDMQALFFSAESGGVSGSMIHFALLRPGAGADLENLFLSETRVSNQSQYEFWNDSTISPAPVFVTADFEWGADEAHYDRHRFIISAYVLKHPKIRISGYSLEDRYMTARYYDYEDEQRHVLAGEKPEIIGRLRRLKAGTGR